MPITISDAGSSLKIVHDTAVRNIMKAHIRELSVVSDNLLKFHMGSCLQHILISFAEVTAPVQPNANALRDFINDTWLVPLAPGTAPPPAILTDQYNKLVEIGVTLVDDFNKSEAIRLLLVDQSTKLNQMNILLDKIRVETELFREPLVIDDGVPEITYYGYALPGVTAVMPVWAIRKALVTPLGTINQWVNGNKNFSNVWANRTTLPYF